MWEQYKRTLWVMQTTIVAATVAIFAWAHVIELAALFFLTMQIGAVVGAMWATRLKSKIERHSAKLMLRQSTQPSR